jgi:hypothetical protein
MITKKTSFAAFALLTGFVAHQPSLRAETSDPGQISKLLSDVKTEIYQLRQAADAVESAARAGRSHESQAVAANKLKIQVNAAGRVQAKLDESRASATQWQRAAIDRMKPLLLILAADATAIIEDVNSNKEASNTSYKEHVAASSNSAAQLMRLVADFVDYGQTKEHLEQLTEKLELAAR